MTADGRRASVGDYLLAAVAALVVVGFLAGAVSVLWDVANNRTATGVLWLPVGLLCAGVLSVAAWRRTVWGRPQD
jgi:hypothetical protein